MGAATRKLAGLLLALLPALHAYAQIDILGYDFRDLRTMDEIIDLDEYRGRIGILMLFQPECEYCVRQSRALNNLIEECPGTLAPIAVGINGSRANLQKEMRSMRATFPVTQASASFEADLGDVIGTPLLLLSDHDGRLVTWMRGYQSTDTLKEVVAKIDASACDQAD